MLLTRVRQLALNSLLVIKRVTHVKPHLEPCAINVLGICLTLKMISGMTECNGLHPASDWLSPQLLDLVLWHSSKQVQQECTQSRSIYKMKQGKLVE